MADEVLLEVRDGVAILTLNRPDAANAIDAATAHGLDASSQAIAADRSVRAVLVRGAGARFCGGGDVKTFAAHEGPMGELLQGILVPLHAAMGRLARLDVPVVAAVHGSVAGAGLGLMASCDLVLAAQSTKLVMAYTQIGFTPDGSTSWYVTRRVGLGRALELALTNRVLSADEACAWGLVNRVVADDEIGGQGEALAAQLAAGPTVAFGIARRLLRDSWQASLPAQLEAEAAGIAGIGATQDAREGPRAFVERRPASFEGR